MSSSIDLEAWQQALADRQAAAVAQQRFEQHRFTIGEHERHAAAASVRYQAEQAEARLRLLRAAAEGRQNQLEQRLSDLVGRREQLKERASRGEGLAVRINKANRTLQTHISDCAVQINVLAKLLSADHPDEIAGFSDDEIAFLTLPMDARMWTGPAEVALPRIVAGAGVVALLAAFLPWFTSPDDSGASTLWTGIANDATTTPALILGYIGIVLPVLLAAVALSALRYRSWPIIGTTVALTFVWIGLCYARITTTLPWWSIPELFDAMHIGARIYAASAFAALVAACYYAQGESNTVQRSLRTAGWLVILFVLPGLLAAGLLALRPGPPPVTVGVSPVDDQPDMLLLTVTNNTDDAIDISVPWSNETPYGIRLEIRLPGAELFRTIEDTADCWRVPTNAERTVNRLPVAPSMAESVWFDVACLKALGYVPERVRFSLTNADGHTIKAYQAIIPQ